MSVAGAAAAPLDRQSLLDRAATFRARWQEDPGQVHLALGLARALGALQDAAGLLDLVNEVGDDRAIVDRVLAIGRRNMPGNIALTEAWCRFPEATENWRDAGVRWYMARGKFPDQVVFHVGFVRALLKLERVDEAERAAQSALRALGRGPELLALEAEVTQAAAIFAARPPAIAAPVIGPSLDPPEIIRKRLMAFENLGRNCEFGLLQRAFDAEPLGLLRFSTTRVRTLLMLLQTRFAGMGDPEAHTVVLRQGEWRLRHDASGWRTHTRVMGRDQPDGEQVLREKCRHTSFLARKLVRDLEASAKIWVYYSGDLDEQQAIQIHDALQEYAPNLLLAVRLGSGQQPPGTVLSPKPTLMLAHLDRPGKQFSGAGWDISKDYWLHFCALAEQRKTELGLGGATETGGA